MRSPDKAIWPDLIAVLLFAAAVFLLLPARAAELPHYSAPGTWPQVLEPLGLTSGKAEEASVFVVRPKAEPPADWERRVQNGACAVFEGDTAIGRTLGFAPGEKRVTVRSVTELRSPKLEVVWQKPLELPVYQLPAGATVFAREKWEGAPLVAGIKRGGGCVLWVAADPGAGGYERFPYLPQALHDLGVEPQFRSARLWAFLDTSYRLRTDVEYFAERWRRSGIAALHIAGWHYWEPDPQRDAWLKALIEACHRRAIQVYAWVELPHVSERFWVDHPEWREKTALGTDAHLDWRKLMNLANPECSKAVSEGMNGLLERFDWDGVNLAELYFESLEGYENPARFTPFNADVRREFKARQGFDPAELYEPASAHFHRMTADGMRLFLDYRAALARQLQQEWLQKFEEIRTREPHLDLVLTHVDDRFDKTMRDKIGADAAALVPLAPKKDFTFLIEDPATVWDLGPQRYGEIAKRYAPLGAPGSRLAIDLNIVERYQDVYPTKRQTGTELLSLIRHAAVSFSRVALYFESSLTAVDAELAPSAAAAVTRATMHGEKLSLESPQGVGVRWNGAAKVNGKIWPVTEGGFLLLPAGSVTVEPAKMPPPLRVTDFNGNLKSAAATGKGVELKYDSSARAFAVFERRPARLELDGVAATGDWVGDLVLRLPRGEHKLLAE
jgi:hypothetical protein